MWSNRGPKGDKQARISASVVRNLSLSLSLSLFFDSILVSAKNSNSQNHEDAYGKIILIAFKLIVGYNLLIETQNLSRLFSKNLG